MITMYLGIEMQKSDQDVIAALISCFLAILNISGADYADQLVALSDHGTTYLLEFAIWSFS